jgi:hypothetical protein
MNTDIKIKDEFIKIEVLKINRDFLSDEEWVSVDFKIFVKSGDFSGATILKYGNLDFFANFTEQLLSFSFDKNCKAELTDSFYSKKEKKFINYSFLFAIKYFSELGEIEFNCNFENKDERNELKISKSNFSIYTEISKINELGKKLKHWNLLEEKEFLFEF